MKYWGDGNGRDVRESGYWRRTTGDGKAKYFQPIKLGKTISDEI